jgi:tRNA(Leu) C34 or U34 (ribose-2'-O)-methylase TrmL
MTTVLPTLGTNHFFFTRFGATNMYETQFPSKPTDECVLVFGSETNGFDDIAKKHNGLITPRIAIPCAPSADELHEFRSLNLSTSVGMAISEVRRQQHTEALAHKE